MSECNSCKNSSENSHCKIFDESYFGNEDFADECEFFQMEGSAEERQAGC